jgi:hypothetical protein
MKPRKKWKEKRSRWYSNAPELLRQMRVSTSRLKPLRERGVKITPDYGPSLVSPFLSLSFNASP